MIVRRGLEADVRLGMLTDGELLPASPILLHTAKLN